MSPLRVCIDARLRAGRFGGVEQVLIGIAAGLSALEDGDEEFLFLTNPGEEDWIRPYVGGPCRLLPTRRGSAQRRVRAVVRGVVERTPRIGPRFSLRVSDGTVERAGADLVHFPIQDAFLTELPSIYQPHDLQHLHHPEFFSAWERARRERIYRTHCERARMVVAMTSWGRRDLVESYGLPEEKVRVVPWGSVLWEYPKPSAADLERLRRALSLPDRFLLYPAQTWPHKNHERLLEALALIKRREGLAVPLVCPGKRTRLRGLLGGAAGRVIIGRRSAGPRGRRRAAVRPRRPGGDRPLRAAALARSSAAPDPRRARQRPRRAL